MSCISCHRDAAKDRKECNRCRYRRRKIETPYKISYWALKSSAKRRNKDFTLTLQEFIDFCKTSEYLQKSGRSSTALHIDRIEEDEGYHSWNIQALENADNVRKYRKWLDRDENGQAIFTTITVKPQQSQEDEDCPF